MIRVRARVRTSYRAPAITIVARAMTIVARAMTIVARAGSEGMAMVRAYMFNVRFHISDRRDPEQLRRVQIGIPQTKIRIRIRTRLRIC